MAEVTKRTKVDNMSTRTEVTVTTEVVVTVRTEVVMIERDEMTEDLSGIDSED